MQTLLRLWRALEDCPWRRAIPAEWQERLGADFARAQPHLKPTGALAGTYPCPSGGGDGCPRQVHDRGGTFVATCGNLPVECSPVSLKKTELAVQELDRPAALAPLVAAVRDQELLAPVDLPHEDGLLPVGMLVRRMGRTLVVLASPEACSQRAALLELRQRADAVAVAVLVPGPWDARLVSIGHVELGFDPRRGFRLWRALHLLWPESWAARFETKEAIFEDVELVFAAEPDKHVVLLNGEPMQEFRISDAKFARLMRLAAARWADPDIEGGWLKKVPHLQLDDREVDLVELRNALVAEQPDGFAGMTAVERKALVQASKDRPGLLRLPLNPRHIRFDPSLENLRLLGDQQNEPRAPAKGKRTKTTPGSSEFTRNKAQARAKVLKMLSEARKLGVPLPEESALRSRPTGR